MTNIHAIRYFSIMHDIRSSMRKIGFSSKVESAIASTFGFFAALPNPAGFSFFYLVKKSFHALSLLGVAGFVSACANERIVQKPVVVETEVVRYIPIPADLLIHHEPTTIPESVTYGESLTLWAADRAIIDTLLGQIRAIEILNDSTE